jgi:hypothetical protein
MFDPKSEISHTLQAPRTTGPHAVILIVLAVNWPWAINYQSVYVHMRWAQASADDILE